MKLRVKDTHEYSYENSTYHSSGIELRLKRKSDDLLIGAYYVPTAVFAMLSKISFFIPPEKVQNTSFNPSNNYNEIFIIQ